MELKKLFIITSLTNAGGTERTLQKIVSSLSREHTLIVCLSKIGNIALELIQGGYSVIPLNMSPTFFNPIAFFRLINIIMTYKPDIVSTWLYHADLLGGIAARLVGHRAIIWNIRQADVSSSSNNTKWLTRCIIRLSAKLSYLIPAAIICNSQQATKNHIEIGYNADQFHVIRNGFDTHLFHANHSAYLSLRNRLCLSHNTHIIGMIARFHSVKNHHGFIQAAANLHKQAPDVHFVLAGSNISTNNQQLMAWIQSAGLYQHVHLLGDKQDIAKLTAGFDIATLTSWSESFPTVVGEAMSCAVPCVVTDVGDAANIVGDTGLIVPVGDMQAMANGWKQLLDLPPEEREILGLCARQRIIDHFELSKTLRQFRDLFDETAQRYPKKD